MKKHIMFTMSLLSLGLVASTGLFATPAEVFAKIDMDKVYTSSGITPEERTKCQSQIDAKITELQGRFTANEPNLGAGDLQEGGSNSLVAKYANDASVTAECKKPVAEVLVEYAGAYTTNS